MLEVVEAAIDVSGESTIEDNVSRNRAYWAYNVRKPMKMMKNSSVYRKKDSG